jgi:hypothetical protein
VSTHGQCWLAFHGSSAQLQILLTVIEAHLHAAAYGRIIEIYSGTQIALGERTDRRSGRGKHGGLLVGRLGGSDARAGAIDTGDEAASQVHHGLGSGGPHALRRPVKRSPPTRRPE